MIRPLRKNFFKGFSREADCERLPSSENAAISRQGPVPQQRLPGRMVPGPYTFAMTSSRSTRRSTLPTFVFGRLSRNTTLRGTL